MDKPEEFEDLPVNISYVPQGNASGLQVRIVRDGKRHQKFYALSHFQSPGDCLFAARAWRDLKLSELPSGSGPPMKDPQKKEEIAQKISDTRTRTGIRGFGFQVTKERKGYRASAHVQWREHGSNQGRMRGLQVHGLTEACNQLSRVLVEHHDGYENIPARTVARRMEWALRQLISAVYHLGYYPTDKPDDGARYEKLLELVEESEDLPIPKEDIDEFYTNRIQDHDD